MRTALWLARAPRCGVAADAGDAALARGRVALSDLSSASCKRGMPYRGVPSQLYPLWGRRSSVSVLRAPDRVGER
jgi:hypothetical protein